MGNGHPSFPETTDDGDAHDLLWPRPREPGLERRCGCLEPRCGCRRSEYLGYLLYRDGSTPPLGGSYQLVSS